MGEAASLRDKSLGMEADLQACSATLQQASLMACCLAASINFRRTRIHDTTWTLPVWVILAIEPSMGEAASLRDKRLGAETGYQTSSTSQQHASLVACLDLCLDLPSTTAVFLPLQ